MSTLLPPDMRVIERNWLSSNMIVFDNGLTITVVDTGYDKHAGITESLVDAARLGRPLTRIINTHLHSDHCGGNARLADRHACEILVPSGAFEASRSWNRSALSFDATGQRCQRFVPTGMIEPGQTLRLGERDWQIHAAPGHDPDAILLFEPTSKTLISADALWQDGFGVTFPELSGDSGFAEQAAVLDRIEALAPARVIPGHGSLFTDVGAALGRARSRLDYLRRNPTKHAAYAIKVLVRYLMLELESAYPAQILDRLGSGAIVRHTAAQLGLTPDEAIRWAIDQLTAGGQLEREGSGPLLSR